MHAIRHPAAAVGALVAASLLTAASPAHADPHSVGTASATTARLGLDVRLINSTVEVPVSVSLNAIKAPERAEGAMLRTTVQGVRNGAPQTLVDAVLGHSAATADARGSHAEVDLVTARITVPGLLGQDVLGLKEVSARADCPAHGQPSAQADVLGDLVVLGKAVSLSAGGPTHVVVPGVGVVDLELSRHSATSTAAAATALELSVAINPLDLNVAKVTGTIELAAVSCSRPAGGDGAISAPPTGRTTPPAVTVVATSASAPAAAADSMSPQPGTASLAQTGGGSGAPALAGAAVLLVGAGTGVVVLTRRRRGQRR